MEEQLADFMKPLFGEMAEKAIQLQKERLGVKGEPTKEGYLEIVKSISTLCRTMAGDSIAHRMEEGLTKIVTQDR